MAEEENEEDEMTFENATLKELSSIKDLILKDDYLSEVVTKAVGTPLSAEDISKAVGGSALVTAQQDTLNLVKSLAKQLTTMEKVQSGLVKAVATMSKVEEIPEEEVPEEEKQVLEEDKVLEEVPKEEKQVEDEVPKEEIPIEEVPEEEKQVEDKEEVPEEEKQVEDEEEVPEEEKTLEKMVTAETSWEDVHNLAKRVRPY